MADAAEIAVSGVAKYIALGSAEQISEQLQALGYVVHLDVLEEAAPATPAVAAAKKTKTSGGGGKKAGPKKAAKAKGAAKPVAAVDATATVAMAFGGPGTGTAAADGTAEVALDPAPAAQAVPIPSADGPATMPAPAGAAVSCGADLDGASVTQDSLLPAGPVTPSHPRRRPCRPPRSCPARTGP